MKNLFICHSQSHLILAAGLSKGRFVEDENQLILFKDFNLKEELKERLEKVFTACLFLEGTFPAAVNMTFRGRIKWYRNDVKILKTSIKFSFDRVFAVCDWTYPVQYALKRCVILNTALEVNWLEDGIIPYYSNVRKRKGLDKYALTMWMRKVFFIYFMRLGEIYDRDFEGMGGLSLFKKAYVSYPKAVREPYRSKKELVEITNEEFRTGIALLYPSYAIDIPDKSTLLIMDKLDTYLYPEKVKAVIAELIQSAIDKGGSVFCKLHPREDQSWDVFDKCHMLDKTLGAESMYLSLLSQRDSINVVGIKSAGLMTAKKMGFTVTSLFLESGETNEDLVSFFRLIGIELK